MPRPSPAAESGPGASPRIVVFDLGSVVARFHRRRRLEALAAAAHLAPEAVYERLWASGFDDDCDRGRYDGDAMCAEINARLGCALPYAEMERLWMRALEPDPETLALVREVAARRPVALLTDNSALVESGLPAYLPEVAAALPTRLFSWRLGALKSEPGLFPAAGAALGAAPGNLLMVDDSPRALASAKAAGWQTLAFTTAAAARAPLLARLDAPAPAAAPPV